MSSNELLTTLTTDEQQQLLDVAAASIWSGLRTGRPLEVSADEFSTALRQPRATFVTLRIGEALRGCMGSLAANVPLVCDVARNAYAAAFRDPRFPPVSAAELDSLEIHISVLSPPEPLPFASEADLLSKIRPGVDGLILYEDGHRGTLLPAVWDHIRDPGEFLAHLKLKAGLPADYWSETIRIERYTAESIPA